MFIIIKIWNITIRIILSTTKTTKSRKFISLLFLLNLFVNDVTSVLFSTIDYICICVLIVFVYKSFFLSLTMILLAIKMIDKKLFSLLTMSLLTKKTIDKKLFLSLTMSLLTMKIIDKSFLLVKNFSQIRIIENFLQTFLFFYRRY